MRDLRTISDLAREADVPTSTVRYYERAGLIQPDSRTEANYRVYTKASVDRLRFIKAAQAAGFKIADIKKLLELKDGDTTQCKTVKPVIQHRLAEVQRQAEDLAHMQHILKGFLAICDGSDEDGDCGVIGKLDPGD